MDILPDLQRLGALLTVSGFVSVRHTFEWHKDSERRFAT